MASLLILVRPEGFFIGVLWGAWVLLAVQPSGQRLRLQLPTINSVTHVKTALLTLIRPLLLASGMIFWWVTAYWLTGDRLWIVHDWPSDWQAGGQANGTGPIWWYAVLLPLIVGIPLVLPFLIGLRQLIKQREFIYGTSAFLTLFVLHSMMFAGGWFGSAGYARYFVCVSPVIALITLAGWNHLANQYGKNNAKGLRHLTALALLLAAITCAVSVDAVRFTRDARGVEAMHTWLRSQHPELFEPSSKSVSRLICSQAYARILLDRDPWEKPSFTADRNHNLELLRQSPAGTLVLWDEETGPKWHRLQAEDFETCGYERMKTQDFILEGWLVRLKWDRIGGPRAQRMHWFYKPSNELPSTKNQL